MLGELCALGAAVTWALSLILFKRSEQIQPAAMNLFKNVLAMVLLLASFPLFGVSFPTDRPPEDWLRLIFSGVLGIAVADTLSLTALRRLGASLFAVVECSYAPVMVLLGVLVLGEPMGGALAVGGVFVVGGVLLAVSETSDTSDDSEEAKTARAGRVSAGLIGATGIVTMGVGVIIAKPIIETSNLVEVTFVRLAAGVAAQLLWILVVPSQRGILRVFRPSPAWRTLVPAAVLGTYVAMLFWLGGFKWTSATRASLLNQTSSVFTIGLAWLLLGERASRRRIGGAALALGGALLVLLR